MKPTAVQFGAGNIGRGFTAQLFHEAGLEVVFVDVIPEVLSAINANGEYTIHIVGPSPEDVRISNIRAIDSRESGAVAEEIAKCEIVCTAVGAAVLPRIAPNIALGLVRRLRLGSGPLNILICENLHDAGAALRRSVADCLDDDLRHSVLEWTGFVQAVVSRMVPLQTRDRADPLGVRVEAYKRLPVDATAVRGELPKINGVEPVGNFEAHVERKLFTHNCAHATLGYLGYHRGFTYGYEALNDGEVRSQLRDVLKESGDALIARHHFDRREHASLVSNLLERFGNKELGDTCFRLAKDPIRKLAPRDRLVGAARLCEQQGISPVAIAQVIAAALKFDASDDPSAVELQNRIRVEGIGSVLELVCGIRSDERLGQSVLETYGVNPVD